MRNPLVFLLAAATAFPQTGAGPINPRSGLNPAESKAPDRALTTSETGSSRHGRRVVNDALAALGGGRYLAMQDRMETGRGYSFYHEKLSGLGRATIYTRYLARPEPPVPGALLVEERQSSGPNERSGAVLFTGGKAYEITYRGARPLLQERADRFKDSTLHNVFYILRERLGEPGMAFDYRGADTMDNRPVDIVDIGDADNRTVTVYFDQISKLPMRQVYYWLDPKTRDRNEEVTIFAKFRDVGGGVQWPYDIQRMRNDEKIYEMYSDTVEINKALASSMFELPPGIHMWNPEH